jgi:serine protease Do
MRLREKRIANCKLQIENCKLQTAFILHFAICILQFAIILPAGAQDVHTFPTSLPAREEAALRAAVEQVADSVVQIRTIGGLDAVDETPIVDGPTTGLVISADGFVVSSAFNFVQQPASILVTLPSGKQAAAELVATDHSRMLVLLKLGGVQGLGVPTFAPADEIRVGQWAIAVGRTFRADRTNVSVGVVSALGRMFGKAVQTDASVSTANYGGPLVDIRGRVLGVLVPMAPQATSEVAGVEWYDSGIGFAVPLASIAPAIERMKKGEDQYAGILGISLAGRTPMASLAALAAVRPDSPAGKAGLKKGDRITEVDGRPVKTQTDLRMALGSRYAGESIRVTAKRGEENIQRTISLVGKMAPFRHAFLGILPLRPVKEEGAGSKEPGARRGEPGVGSEKSAAATDEEKESDSKAADATPKGVTVRMVYPGSPAAEAHIQAGDRVVQINGAKVADVAAAIAELNNVAPDSEVKVSLIRKDEPLVLKLTAGRLPTSNPSELPTAYEQTLPSNGEAASAAGETRDLKLAALPQKCKVYVPAAHAAGRPLGVLIWLHAPGESNPEEVIKHWQPICDRDGLVLVVPTAEDVKQWERTELEYLQALTERVLRQYKPDPRRIVVYGQGGGGGMAYLLALSGRSIFTGVATTAAPLPRQIKVPDSEPALRLAVWSGLPGDASSADIAQGLKKLVDGGYPVSTTTVADLGGRLADAERDELARWIDTLDRF